jgi:copper(I)-binding protein
MKKLLHTTALAATLMAAFANVPAWAQTATVKVEGAWARASVQGQKGTGAFMRLTAQDGARLVRAESPAAGVTEVHEMKMEGDVMKMRAVPRLELPAGKPVDLSGDHHIMFMGLNKELKAGDKVSLTLKLERSGKPESVNIDLEIRALDSGKTSGGHHHHH